MTVRTFLIEPFDIMLHATEEGVGSLQARFSTWLRTLREPARFVCWQMPATLNDKISGLSRKAQEVEDSRRRALLMEYRRHFESLNDGDEYQRALCGMALWSEQNSRSLGGGLVSAFETQVTEGAWPSLFEGRYEIREAPFWHLAPTGRPGGRPYWSILTSYEFAPATWNFFRPLPPLLRLNFPLALSVDISRTYDRNAAINAIEGIIQAYQVHLAGVTGEDSRSVQRIADCRKALQEINNGDALHMIQLTLAVAADDLTTLRERVQTVINETHAWFLLRQEVGELLARSVGFFTAKRTKEINVPTTTWPVTSRELALMLSPLGYRKLASTDGILRGEAVGASYPVFHNSWRDKRATHEIWVGVSGFGKTFGLNCYLTREYAENGIPFDMLEPMGHGRHIADAFGLPWYVMSAKATKLNPQDVMFPTLIEQVSHVTRIYETVLGRILSGAQRENLERGLLGEALEILYRGFPHLSKVTPELAPTWDVVCDVLSGLSDKEATQHIAKNLADEIAGLCTGSGPWAEFLNGATNVNLSRGGRDRIEPRIFSFHELESDPILQALAYTQVSSAIRRDSLIDEQPRIIAVDEVYRLMRHPSLLDFLIEAAKTFRTRRKKLICVDLLRPNWHVFGTAQRSQSKITNKPSSNVLEAIRKFAPLSNQGKISRHKQYIDIFISTDKYGVGVNMQDADTVINYDLPWDAIVPHQRAGRILRPWKDTRTVEIYLFVSQIPSETPDSGYQGLENQWQKLVRRHSVSTTLLDLPVMTTSLSENVDMMAIGKVIPVGEIDYETLGSVETETSKIISKHMALLEHYRNDANLISEDIISAVSVEIPEPLLYMLLKYKQQYYPVLYNPVKHALLRRKEITILDLIACDPTTPKALVERDLIEQLGNECIELWCNHNHANTDDVSRICLMYLQPDFEDDKLSNILK